MNKLLELQKEIAKKTARRHLKQEGINVTICDLELAVIEGIQEYEEQRGKLKCL